MLLWQNLTRTCMQRMKKVAQIIRHFMSGGRRWPLLARSYLYYHELDLHDPGLIHAACISLLYCNLIE